MYKPLQDWKQFEHIFADDFMFWAAFELIFCMLLNFIIILLLGKHFQTRGVNLLSENHCEKSLTATIGTRKQKTCHTKGYSSFTLRSAIQKIIQKSLPEWTQFSHRVHIQKRHLNTGEDHNLFRFIRQYIAENLKNK